MKSSIKVIADCVVQVPGVFDKTFNTGDIVQYGSRFYWALLWSGLATETGIPTPETTPEVPPEPVIVDRVGAQDSDMIQWSEELNRWVVSDFDFEVANMIAAAIEDLSGGLPPEASTVRAVYDRVVTAEGNINSLAINKSDVGHTHNFNALQGINSAAQLATGSATPGYVVKMVGTTPTWQPDTDTTYAVISEAEIEAGVSSVARTISGAVLKAYVDVRINALIDGAPSTMDTLGEISNALAAEDDVAASILNQLNAHISDHNNPHVVTKAQVGLGSVDNTADVDKPVSTAQQAALDAKDVYVASATNGNVVLSGIQTIDGIPGADGQLVLIKSQATASQNGVYVMRSSAWERAPFASTMNDLAGLMVTVKDGAYYGGSTWGCVNSPADTLGTTAIDWLVVPKSRSIPKGSIIYGVDPPGYMEGSSVGTTGQVLHSGGSGAPGWGTPSAKVVVTAATTANIALTGTQTVDGVNLPVGALVLVKNQTNPTQNGIYTVLAGAWMRHAFTNTSATIAGAIVSVLSGAVNGGKTFHTDFKSTDTLDTTNMKWYEVMDERVKDRANHTGTQLASTISDLSEAVDDRVAQLLSGGTGIQVSYDDVNNKLTLTVVGGNETDAEAVRDIIGVALVGVGLVGVTYNDAADTVTISTTATANSSDAFLLNRANHTGIIPDSGLPERLNGAPIAVTVNTTNSFRGQYAKLAAFTITAKYGDFAASYALIATGSGNAEVPRARILLRAKQNSDLGAGPPIMSLYVEDIYKSAAFDETNIAMVITAVDASKSVIELWIKSTTLGYEEYKLYEEYRAGALYNVQYFQQAPFQLGLPAPAAGTAALYGSQYRNINASRLTGDALLTTDWNTATQTGFYYSTLNTVNAPTADAWQGFVVSRDNGNYVKQVVFFTNPGEGAYSRQLVTGVWQPWKLLRFSADEQDARYLQINSGTIPDARLPARLGTVGKTITDWNATIESGLYRGNNATGAPTQGGSGDWYYGEVIGFDSNYALQILTHVAVGERWFRQKNGGTWQEWKRLNSQAEADARYAQLEADTNTFTGNVIFGSPTVSGIPLTVNNASNGTAKARVITNSSTGKAQVELGSTATAAADRLWQIDVGGGNVSGLGGDSTSEGTFLIREAGTERVRVDRGGRFNPLYGADIDDGGEVVRFKPGTQDHVYAGWYPDSGNPDVRGAYTGFGNPADPTFVISNEMTNGDVNLQTNGTGEVKANGDRVATAVGGGKEKLAAAIGTSGAVTLDASVASVFTLTPTADVTSLAVTNAPAGVACTLTLVISQGATVRAIATPTGGIWLGGAPTQVANKKCVITLMSTDGGTSWICSGAVQA